jgi:2-methylcitrate dehydratase PrpD
LHKGLAAGILVMMTPHPEKDLARFAAHLTAEAIPDEVHQRAEDLFLDWVACALAGKSSRPVESLSRFASAMGPAAGESEVLTTRQTSSPYFAAFANAAASHVAEQDDVHNGSVFHPGTVVFPVALALAQQLGRSGPEFLAAAVAGYEVGIRVGEFLGRAHYSTFHTTGTAGTLAAAVAAGHLLKLDDVQMLHALGSAGTQAAGLWEFLRDAADSKQLHTAHAASAGLASAWLAADGFTGARRIITGTQGMARGLTQDSDPARLIAGLGSRWTLAETSFKYHASCRHTHPAADALQQVLLRHGLHAGAVKSVITRVHQAAIDVLGPVRDPQTVHQSKFSMGTVLALIAVHGRAGLTEFDAHFRDEAVVAFRERVRMELDEEVDRAYPARWIGKVVVETHDGRCLEGRVDEPKGDPGNTLSRREIEHKAVALAAYQGGATPDEMRKVIARVWSLREVVRMPLLLQPAVT